MPFGTGTENFGLLRGRASSSHAFVCRAGDVDLGEAFTLGAAPGGCGGGFGVVHGETACPPDLYGGLLLRNQSGLCLTFGAGGVGGGGGCDMPTSPGLPPGACLHGDLVLMFGVARCFQGGDGGGIG